MRAQQRYRETHGGKRQSLRQLQESIVAQAVRQPGEISRIAREAQAPEATLRGVLSFYADFQSKSDQMRVCQGTSCKLAGAAALASSLRSRFACQDVYCLGHCDRSPAVLSEEGEVFTGDQALALASGASEKTVAHEHRTSLRCLAPEPIVLRHVLKGNASDLAAARAQGIYQTLAQALRGSPQEILDVVEHSEQRGRGGAGFLTGAKWSSCARAPAQPKYVVVNGDEGDPGSFIDRVLMEDDPHSVLEGLILCAYAVGASQGIIFIRSEYPRAIARMRQAIVAAYEQGILGASVLGSKFALEVSICTGLGSYVCGEETAMLNAIEGWRGEVRIRPPYPAIEGLYGKPTVVNNVETLVSIPFIVEWGAEVYAALGTARSKGTKVFSLNHGFARPGLVEVEFGATLLEVIEEAGEGAGGKRLEAAILGGPMGSVLLPHEWSVPVCYVRMAEEGIQLGHGGLVAIPEGTDFRVLLEHWLEFMMDESCGKCVPCRLGSKRAWRVLHEQEGTACRARLGRLFEAMEAGSLCAFGQSMPRPMRKLMERFGDSIFKSGGRL
ncbi:MAG: NADH-ubiquinone oxidoreductase-F iron-sulfur binding region domain-containing protein [Terriglobia bacterium]